MEHILFLDIETVPEKEGFDLLDDEKKNFGNRNRNTSARTNIRPRNFMTGPESGPNSEK